MNSSRLRTMFDLWKAQMQGADGLARRSDKRFTALLTYARSASPFYRNLYRDLPFDGVARCDLPPVNKRALMAAFDDWVTDSRIRLAGVKAFLSDPGRIGALYQGAYFVCTSSGTTGHPGIFVADGNAVDTYRAITFGRILPAWAGTNGMLRLVRRAFRWGAVVGTGGHYAGAGWMELERRRSWWLAHAFRVFSVQQPLPELIAELNAFDPAMLTAYPSALELLAEEQEAGRLQLRPAMIEISGESATPEAKARAAAAFGCTVHDMYSASECLTMAFSCAHGWLHVNSDWALLEPVDEHFRPSPPGCPSHTVLLTNLANRIQPLIRYDLGDSILTRADTCPCGSPLPAIQVVGRRDDVLRLVAARGHTIAIVPLAISSIVDATPGVHRSQIVQTGAASLRVRLEPEPERDEDAVWRDVAQSLLAYLAAQGLSNVEVIRGREPPQQGARLGKFRQVIAVQRSET